MAAAQRWSDSAAQIPRRKGRTSVEKQHVCANVDTQRRVEALDEGDCTARACFVLQSATVVRPEAIAHFRVAFSNGRSRSTWIRFPCLAIDQIRGCGGGMQCAGL